MQMGKEFTFQKQPHPVEMEHEYRVQEYVFLCKSTFIIKLFRMIFPKYKELQMLLYVIEIYFPKSSNGNW